MYLSGTRGVGRDPSHAVRAVAMEVKERETVSACLLKLALFCAVLQSVRMGRLGRTLHVRIVFSPSVFLTQCRSHGIEKCCRGAWARALVGLPSWQIALLSVLLWGPVSPSGQQSLSLQHWEDFNTLAIFLSACALHVYFL